MLHVFVEPVVNLQGNFWLALPEAVFFPPLCVQSLFPPDQVKGIIARVLREV